MLDDGLLVLESTLEMPLMKLPVKMTLVRLGDRVVLISPLPDIDAFKKKVNSFGEITDIVTPNLFHSLGVEKAASLYPNAKLWGTKGFKEKFPQLKWHEFNESWPYIQGLPYYKIDGMPKVNEVTLLHVKSKTLIVADLCFNHLKSKGVGSWIVFNIFGTYRKFAVSKLFLKMVKNRQAFTQSVQRLLKNKFENIIIPHGGNIKGGGHELLIKALRDRKVLIDE